MNSLSLVNDFKTSIIDLKKPQVFIYQHLINQLQTFLCKLLKKIQFYVFQIFVQLILFCSLFPVLVLTNLTLRAKSFSQLVLSEG